MVLIPSSSKKRPARNSKIRLSLVGSAIKEVFFLVMKNDERREEIR